MRGGSGAYAQLQRGRTILSCERTILLRFYFNEAVAITPGRRLVGNNGMLEVKTLRRSHRDNAADIAGPNRQPIRGRSSTKPWAKAADTTTEK